MQFPVCRYMILTNFYPLNIYKAEWSVVGFLCDLLVQLLNFKQSMQSDWVHN